MNTEERTSAESDHIDSSDVVKKKSAKETDLKPKQIHERNTSNRINMDEIGEEKNKAKRENTAGDSTGKRRRVRISRIEKDVNSNSFAFTTDRTSMSNVSSQSSDHPSSLGRPKSFSRPNRRTDYNPERTEFGRDRGQEYNREDLYDYSSYSSETMRGRSPQRSVYREKYDQKRTSRQSKFGDMRSDDDFKRNPSYSSDQNDSRPYINKGNSRRYNSEGHDSGFNSTGSAYGSRRPSGANHRTNYNRRNNSEAYRGRLEAGNSRYDNRGKRPFNNNFNNDNSRRPSFTNNRYKKVFKHQSSEPRTPVLFENQLENESDPIRLNKYMSNSGVCSRREADEFIQQGRVKVNGEVVTELGTKILVTDEIKLNDIVLSLEKRVYVLLNKPKKCVTTSEDPQERLTVMDLVKSACSQRIYPVGRLDRNTTGVLLLTNDGELATKLMHPAYEKKKIYHVWLDKPVEIDHMQKIADGIELDDGEIHADAISYVNEEDLSQVGIEIHSGRNRIVRRIFEQLGYKVLKLDRVYFAGLTKKNLPRGKWRYLSQKEVEMLRMGAFS